MASHKQHRRVSTEFIEHVPQDRLATADEFGSWFVTEEDDSTDSTISHPSAYESRPSSVQEDRNVRGRRPPLHLRLSDLHKSLEQDINIQEAKIDDTATGNKSRLKSYRKAVSLGANLELPASTNDGIRGLLASPLLVPNPPTPSLPFARPPAWFKRIVTPNRESIVSLSAPSKRIVSHPPVPQLDRPFSTSVPIAEGILHPGSSIKPKSRGHSGNRTRSENVVSHETVFNDSRFSGLLSSRSNRLKGTSLIIPLSGFFNKSTEVIADGLWTQRPLDKLTRSGSSSPTGHSREGSFYFEKSEEGISTPTKSKSWVKLLNGYVSPRSHSRSRNAKGDDSFDLSIKPRNRGRSTRMNHSQTVQVANGHYSGGLPSIASDQSACRRKNDSTCVPTVCNSKFLLCTVLLHILLFWVCPPSLAVSLGGYGMLLVYSMLLLGIICVLWMIFEDEALVTPGEGTLTVIIEQGEQCVD